MSTAGSVTISPRLSRFKRSVTVFTTIVVAFAVVSCSASGQRFNPGLLEATDNNSKIVVYRVSQFVGGGYTASIVLDGQPMGHLKNAGFIDAAVPPGHHVIEIDKWFWETGGRYPTPLETRPGCAYFVRYDESAKRLSVVDGFSVVPETRALQELATLKESK